MAEYEPKVVAFCCHYCAYSAADLAGSMRLEYPPNVRIIKLMYFDTPQDTSNIEGAADMRVMLSLNGIMILVLGLYPELIMGLVTTVI